MGKYFLIKEHRYGLVVVSGKNCFMGQDLKLLPGSYAESSEALADAKKAEQGKDDVIYVVEIAAKCYGNTKEASH